MSLASEVSNGKHYVGLIQAAGDWQDLKVTDLMFVTVCLSFCFRPQLFHSPCPPLSLLFPIVYWLCSLVQGWWLISSDQLSLTIWQSFLFLAEPHGEDSGHGWFLFFFFLNFYIGVEPINKAVIVSHELQRDSAVHVHVSILPQTPLPSRLPHYFEQSSVCHTIGPCWLFILNTAVCTCRPKLPNYPFPPSFPPSLARISSYSKSVMPFLSCFSALDLFPYPLEVFAVLSFICTALRSALGFPGVLDSERSAFNAGDPDLIPGSGRSPGEGNGNPLHYSCLKNPVDRGAWQATVHGIAKLWYTGFF